MLLYSPETCSEPTSINRAQCGRSLRLLYAEATLCYGSTYEDCAHSNGRALTGRRDSLPLGKHKWRNALYETDVWGAEFCHMFEHDRKLHGAGSRRRRAGLCQRRESLKHKQYAEARTTLEAGLIKNSSNVQAHFNLAEACRGLGAWDCAEEHYETALHLDAKSRITGTREPRLSKMKVWQSLEEVTAWRLLEEAKSLIADGQAQPDKMKQAEEALDGAHELGLNNEQQAVYEQLQAKFPGRRSARSLDDLKSDGLAGMAFPTNPATYRWRWCRQGNSQWGVR